jgi:hypothetical protein
MSLWVYLEGEEEEVPCACDCGHEHVRTTQNEYFSANITHNLTKMADEAGIYEAVWRPEEAGITRAGQLIEPLRRAVAEMRADPPRFERHNAANGWGLYKDFLPWLERYAAACEEYPDAHVRASG